MEQDDIVLVPIKNLDDEEYYVFVDSRTRKIIDPRDVTRESDKAKIYNEIKNIATKRALIDVSVETLQNFFPNILVDVSSSFLKCNIKSITDVVAASLESIASNEASYHSPILVSITSSVFTFLVTQNPIKSIVGGIASLGENAIVNNVNSCPAKAACAFITGCVASGVATAVYNPNPCAIGSAAIVGGSVNAYSTFSNCEMEKLKHNAIPISRISSRFNEIFQEKYKELEIKKIINPKNKQITEM